MTFNEEDLELLADCLKYRIFEYERISYSLNASPDEKIEARKELKKINNLKFNLSKALEETKK
jgi:hypothetical protein